MFAKVYRDNERNVVIDEENRLMWQDSDIKFMDKISAQQHCSSLVFSGYDDWHLPFAHEFGNFKKIDQVRLSSGKSYDYDLGDGYNYYYYWTNSSNKELFRTPGYYAYKYLMQNDKNNVLCVRKLHPYDIVIDKIPNSCSYIKDIIPPKPSMNTFKKRPYETEEEFELSKENSLNRWRSEINNYQKECDFTATIHFYKPKTKILNYSYHITLPGLGEKTVEDKVSPDKAFSFLEQVPGKMVFKAILGMSENEKFYIKKVIYPTPKQKEEVDKAKDNFSKGNQVTGVLDEPCKVKYTKRKNAIAQIDAGTKISYDRYTKEIVSPEKYRKKGAVLEVLPVFKKEISVEQRVSKEDDESIVAIKITSNFKIDTIEIKRVNQKDFEKLDVKEEHISDRWTYSYVFVLKTGEEHYLLRVLGDVDSTYDCNIKTGCQERQLNLKL